MTEDERQSIGEVIRTLHRIEGRLDNWLADHEQRLRRLERAKWVLVGLTAAGAGAVVQGIAVVM